MTTTQTSLFTDADAELTRRIGIVDSHNDFALSVAKWRNEGVYDSLRTYWLPRFHAGGNRVVVAPIYTPAVFVPDGAMRHAIRVMDGLCEEIEENADQIELARSFADVQRITQAGKIAVVLAFEGAEPLGHDLSALRFFYQAGIRMISLTHHRRTAFGDGAWENDSRGGLTRIGRQAIKDMNRLGIIVDISHASDQTTWDILETSTKPVVASHSNARAVRNHRRNLTDDMLKALAAGGGVIGLIAVSRFVADGEPTIARWVDHVEHVVQLIGIDHVGIGADFAHYLFEIGASADIASWSPERSQDVQRPFKGMLSPEDFPGLTAELRRRGFAESDLRKILCENHLRIMAEVLVRP
ncbi:MAG: membrane dipeptidase [Chloroflexi bacterium]|nr:membrane dipeptidase [Chloroflexota bacterium]